MLRDEAEEMAVDRLGRNLGVPARSLGFILKLSGKTLEGFQLWNDMIRIAFETFHPGCSLKIVEGQQSI